MANRPQDAVVLIPSLEPDERLPRYVAALLEKGFEHIVVVDDGSGPDYRPIFDGPGGHARLRSGPGQE